jgi:hypothetical protein
MSVKGRGAILMEGVLNPAEANADVKKIKKAFATSQDFHTGGATRAGDLCGHQPLAPEGGILVNTTRAGGRRRSDVEWPSPIMGRSLIPPNGSANHLLVRELLPCRHYGVRNCRRRRSCSSGESSFHLLRLSRILCRS